MPEAKERWHLDRRVPIALILALFIQTVGVVWWAATTDARVGQLESSLTSMDRRLSDQEALSRDALQNDAVIREQLRHTNENIDRLRGDIRALSDLFQQTYQRN